MEVRSSTAVGRGGGLQPADQQPLHTCRSSIRLLTHTIALCLHYLRLALFTLRSLSNNHLLFIWEWNLPNDLLLFHVYHHLTLSSYKFCNLPLSSEILVAYSICGQLFSRLLSNSVDRPQLAMELHTRSLGAVYRKSVHPQEVRSPGLGSIAITWLQHFPRSCANSLLPLGPAAVEAGLGPKVRIRTSRRRKGNPRERLLNSHARWCYTLRRRLPASGFDREENANYCVLCSFWQARRGPPREILKHGCWLQ